MTEPTHSDIFTEVVNDLVKQLPDASILLRLITNNLDSPLLAEIKYLSLTWLKTGETTNLLRALPKMTGLLSLALPDCELDEHELKFLLTECPALSKLQSLDLSNVFDLKAEDVLLLSQSTTLTNLTSLDLGGCEVFTPRGAPPPRFADGFSGYGSYEVYAELDSSGLIALLSSPIVENLTHLGLRLVHWHEKMERGMSEHDTLVHVAIATSPFLSNLVSLDLSGNMFSPDAVAALAASTTLTNLTHLDLFASSLRDWLLTKLFSPPSLLAKKLQSIDLSYTYITVASLPSLAEASPHLSELTLLGNYRLGPAGVAFIASHMPNLTKLNLGHCQIGDEGYAALAASTTLTNLRKLYLCENQARAESIIALVNSPIMGNLTHLGLGETHTGPEVLIAIAQSPSMAKLQSLRFVHNQAGNDAVIAFVQSTTLKSLTHVDLSRNNLGPDGFRALCTCYLGSKLISLCRCDRA